MPHSYTEFYTSFFEFLKENGGKGYSPIMLGEFRPFKKADANIEDSIEEDITYFYSGTEAEILKRQIIKRSDGQLLLITAIRPEKIEIISDDEMVRLIVQKIMGDDPDFISDEKGISK